MWGFAFLYHGFPKLFNMAEHENFAGMLSGLGIPAPGIMAWAVGVAEFVGGLALILGVLVRPVAFVLTTEVFQE